MKISLPEGGHNLEWYQERIPDLVFERETEKAFEHRGTCPAHDDHHPSLIVFNNKDGSCVPHCQAGCSLRDVLEVLEADMDDPYTRNILAFGKKLKSKKTGDDRDGEEYIDPSLAVAPLNWWSSYTGVPIEFITQLPIEEEDGYVVFTFDGYKAKKRRKAGTKDIDWVPKGTKPTPVLWPSLPSKIEPHIYFVEGESDLTIMRYLKFPAYALSSGAGTHIPALMWRTLQKLGVQKITFILDCDDAGIRGTEKQRQQAQQYGIETSIVDLSYVIDGRFLENDIKDAYKRLGVGLEKEIKQQEAQAVFEINHTLADIAKLEPENRPWRIPNFIPEFGTILLTGDPGVGKSALLFWLFYAAKNGSAFLGQKAEQFNILYMSEDSTDILAERARSYGGNLDNVDVVTLDEAIEYHLGWEDIVDNALKRAIAFEAKLVIFDTLLKWSGVEKINEPTEIGKAMMLCRRFRKHGISCILVMHNRKSGGENGQQVAGSAAIVGESDMAFSMERIDDLTRRLVTMRTKKGTHQPPVYFKEVNGRLEITEATDDIRKSASRQNEDSILDLLAASGSEGITSKDIEQALDLPKSTTSRLLNQLVSKGLAEKRPDPRNYHKVKFYAKQDITINFISTGTDG